MTVSALWLCLTAPWVGQQYAVVIFPDHAHFLLGNLTGKIVNAIQWRESYRNLCDSFRTLRILREFV